MAEKVYRPERITGNGKVEFREADGKLRQLFLDLTERWSQNIIVILQKSSEIDGGQDNGQYFGRKADWTDIQFYGL